MAAVDAGTGNGEAGEDRWLYAWALGYAAAGLASLLVPLYALASGGDAFAVGVIASTAAFAGVPGAILWGWLAQRTGRRREFVLFALALSAIVLGALPLLDSLVAITAVNALLWFAVSAATPVLTLLVVEGHPEARWEARIARLNAFQGYGWVGGLLLGTAWLSIVAVRGDPTVARRWLFWTGALAAAAGIPIAARWLPRRATVSPERVRRSDAALARLASGSGRVRTVPFVPGRLYARLDRFAPARLHARFSRPLLAYLLGVTVFSAAFSVFWGPLPAYLGDRYAGNAVFLLFLVANLASTLFYVPASRIAARRSLYRLQIGSLSARVALFPLVGGVAPLLPVAVQFPALLVLFSLVGVTWAIIAVTGAGIVTRLGEEFRGEALGLYAALAGLGGGIGSLLGGWLATISAPLVFLAAGGGVLLATALVLAADRANHTTDYQIENRNF